MIATPTPTYTYEVSYISTVLQGRVVTLTVTAPNVAEAMIKAAPQIPARSPIVGVQCKGLSK